MIQNTKALQKAYVGKPLKLDGQPIITSYMLQSNLFSYSILESEI